MKVREAFEGGQPTLNGRTPRPVDAQPYPALLTYGSAAHVTSILASQASGARTSRALQSRALAPRALLEFQRAAGNVAVQRMVAAITAPGAPVVQRVWPFDDDEGTADGGDGGSEGAGPVPTDDGSGGGYGGEGAEPVPSEDESGGGYGGESGAGPSGGEPSETSEGGDGGDDGGSFDGGESETGGEGNTGDGQVPSPEEDSSDGNSDMAPSDYGETDTESEPSGGGEAPAELPGEPGSEEQVSEETPEETYDRLVRDGSFAAALAVVVRAYGFGGKDVASITYNPSLGDDGSTDSKGHQLGAGVPHYITIGPSAFSAGYGYCASTIGHEIQHVVQRTQAPPITSKALREFLSYSWQVIEGRNMLSKKYQRANAVQAYEAYQAMTPDDQFMQQGRYGEVVTLLRQLGPANPDER